MTFNYPQRGETMNQEQTQETPKLSTINQVPQDIQNILEETRLSIDAIKKNSKLRMHYLRAIMMNYILRAFAVKYHLEEKYLNTQKALLDALLRVEARPGRQWLTNEKIALADAALTLLKLYTRSYHENQNRTSRVDHRRSRQDDREANPGLCGLLGAAAQ